MIVPHWINERMHHIKWMNAPHNEWMNECTALNELMNEYIYFSPLGEVLCCTQLHLVYFVLNAALFLTVLWHACLCSLDCLTFCAIFFCQSGNRLFPFKVFLNACSWKDFNSGVMTQEWKDSFMGYRIS